MNIKKTIKCIGKFFINLKQIYEVTIYGSVLIVDNGYSRLGELNFAIERIRNYFPKAEISVLTFAERKSNLQKDFPALKFILPSGELEPKRYQIALQMLKMRREKYDFIILFSLDITPLFVSLFVLKSKKIVLYNQWRQWWSLRLRNVSESFRVTYTKEKKTRSFKNLLKSIGLFFILLQRQDEDMFRRSILIVDNSYVSYDQIGYAIQRITESLPQARISVLALEQRKELKDSFPEIDFIKPGKSIIKKYRIARHMLRLRSNKYDYIILLSLDITPIIVSILFMDTNILLNNQWHQWWSLNPKSIRSYLMAIPKFILNIIFNIVIFAYLLISVSWIFLKKSFNIFKDNLLGRKV